MKFLKKFQELNENQDSPLDFYFFYTVCDRSYGYLTWEKTQHWYEISPDLSPCIPSGENISQKEINQHHASDLWGTVYLCICRQKTLLEDISRRKSTTDGEFRFPSKDEFEEGILSKKSDILDWLEIYNYNDGDEILKDRLYLFDSFFNKNAPESIRLFNKLKKSEQGEITNYFKEKGEIDFFNSMINLEDFGVI